MPRYPLRGEGLEGSQQGGVGSGWGGRCSWERMPRPRPPTLSLAHHGLRSLATVPVFQEGGGGLWEAGMGVIYRGHRKSPESGPHPVVGPQDQGGGLPIDPQLRLNPHLALRTGRGRRRASAWRSQSSRIRAGKREGWRRGSTQKEQELWGIQRGCQEERSLGRGLGERRIGRRREQSIHSSLRAQYRCKVSESSVKESHV